MSQRSSRTAAISINSSSNKGRNWRQDIEEYYKKWPPVTIERKNNYVKRKNYFVFIYYIYIHIKQIPKYISYKIISLGGFIKIYIKIAHTKIQEK